MKKALIISYSQAGQTQRAVETLARGLSHHLICEIAQIVPKEDYKFPWSMREFFRAFPKCVQRVAPQIQEMNINWDDFDLVVLAYQVWFLSPSLPVQGFLCSKTAKGLNGKKVLTLTTCRNLWRSAANFVNSSLQKLGALSVGQITLCEISPIWASFVTTPRWMLTGKKEAFWFFPKAGIREQDFENLYEKGTLIGKSFAEKNQAVPETLGSNLNRVSLSLMDAIGYRIFRVWSRFILLIAPQPNLWQDLWLLIFRINLIFLIILIAPCTKLFELIVHNNLKWEPEFKVEFK